MIVSRVLATLLDPRRVVKEKSQMNSKYQIVTLIFALCLVERLQGQFSPCEKCRTGAMPLECSIKGCTSKPCHVVRGGTAVGHVAAITAYNTSRLPVTAVVRLAGALRIQVMEIKEEGCNYLPVDKSCPVHEGQLMVADIPYAIEKSWPRTDVIVEIVVTDDQGHVIACARIPLRLVDG